MRLGGPEGQRRRQQESSGRREDGDADRSDPCLGRHRTWPPARAIGPRIRPGHPQPQDRRPDVNALAHLELSRSRQPLVVQERPVLASEILEEQPLAATGEACVPPADRRMRQPQITAARPSENQRAFTDRQQLAGSRPVLGVKEDLPGPDAGHGGGHRRRPDGVPACAPLPARTYRIRRHPLGRRVVSVERRRLTLVEGKLARVLRVLRAVLGRRSAWRSLWIRWRHARSRRSLIPRPCNDVTFPDSPRQSP